MLIVLVRGQRLDQEPGTWRGTLSSMSWQWEYVERTRVIEGKAESWIRLPAADGFVVAYRLVAHEGDLVPVELRLFAGQVEPEPRLADDPQPERPFDTAHPISARLVAKLRVVDHLAYIKNEILNPPDSEEIGTTSAWLGYTEALLETPAPTSRRQVSETSIWPSRSSTPTRSSEGVGHH
jgi:hypothetical protein